MLNCKDHIWQLFLELVQSEAAGPASILIPEPVPPPQVVILSADDAGEGGTQETTGDWSLWDASAEQLQVLRCVIDPLVGCNRSVGHESMQLVPVGDCLEATKLSVSGMMNEFYQTVSL